MIFKLFMTIFLIIWVAFALTEYPINSNCYSTEKFQSTDGYMLITKEDNGNGELKILTISSLSLVS